MVLVLLFVLLGASAFLVRWRRVGTGRADAALDDSRPHAPAGVRVRVQVINTTKTRGLARRATQLLRDRGFDVVEFGTGGPARDTTLVLDRSGHPAWAATAAHILGTAARAEARPDSSRYLDITILLGSAWRAPSEPLDP